MKRRNADCGKIRRPIKRNKITEGMYGSTTLLYLKFLILWAIVITADFMFMFRFEFLWPFWLLLRSVHDSFKYKGLAFSVLFVCIAITSDLVCLFFIPVHWLLFAASTYVWVQYVWHTDKGICLPTIILWMLFVYLEAGIRWKDSRHMPHLDLCRPFAAHCIGYPVVTLGFGFKSYVGYRMRQRKQREVAKENEFYMQLLQQALPQEEAVDDNIQSAVTSNNISAATTSNGSITSSVATIVTTATGTALQIAQTTVQATIDSHNQHHNYINHTSATSTSGGNGGVHSDDKTHVQLVPSLSTLSSTVATSTTSTTTTVQMTAMQQQQQQTFNNNHVNLNNSNNSSSSKNAQTTNSSKFNNNYNNISNSNNNNSLLMSTTTMIPNGTSSGNIGNGHIVNNNSKLNGLTNTTTTTTTSSSSSFYNKGSRRSVDKDKNHDTNQMVNSLTTNLSNNRISTHDSRSVTSDTCSTKLTSAYLNQIGQLSSSTLSSSNHTQKDFKDNNKDSVKNNWDKDNITSSMSSSCSSNSNKENKMYAANSQSDHQHHHNHVTTNGGTSNVSNDHKKSHNHHNHHPNGNVLQYDVEENNDTSSLASTSAIPMMTTTTTAVTSEKTKGRRNRSKKDSSKDKDNHGHHGQNNSNSTSHHHISNHHNNHNHHHHNNHQQQHHNNTNNNNTTTNNNKTTDANSDASSISSSSSSSSSTSTLSTIASHIVAKICESCLRFEAEIKKYRQEINHMKQIENELRQKLDSNATTKSCLQAKQRELDDLEKRVQDLTNIRQVDMMNLQNAERRLVEERRQRQSLESQLNNEKKARKLAEEKATRPECSEACKQRKQQIESEAKQLRRELKAVEEAKQVAEQQGRKCEQELRMFEAEVRNREAQQGTEVLMSALAAMQDKNSTLEKNLSAETRVKLDLFSALGEAKRQLEIKDSLLRNKDEEVLDLKAKIAQLLAVMPTDTLCLPPCSTTGSSMLRMNDTPPLQGPSSPMGMAALGAAAAAAHQQILTAHQLNRGPVVVSAAAVAAAAAAVVSATTSSSVVTNVSMSMTPSVSAGIVTGSAGSVNNQIGGGGVGNNNNSVVVTQASSNLDPNATAYTPKNSLVGNSSDA